MTQTVRNWLERARDKLGGISATPGLDAELLLARACRRDRSWLFAHRDEAPDATVLERANCWLERRHHGEPIAYITGVREFWSLDLEVTPAVLIPRPDTEILVESALTLIPPARNTSVVDLGTGSGAVAIAIAAERPAAVVTATDRSSAALAVARRNGERLVPGRIRFVQSDWFTRLAAEHFDLIVSNPPYVVAEDPALADAAIRHEPRDALAGGTDGLDAIRLIAAGLAAHLSPGGHVVLEHGAMQAALVAGILRDHGLEVIACRRDLSGNERVTEARLPHTR